MFTYGLGEFIVSDKADQRAARKQRREALRFRTELGRRKQVPIAPLYFPSSCRFCRGGYHHHAHFWSCRRAPDWARRGGA